MCLLSVVSMMSEVYASALTSQPTHPFTVRGMWAEDNYVVHLPKDSNVGDLKRDLQGQTGIPITHQRLIYNAHRLEDDALPLELYENIPGRLGFHFFLLRVEPPSLSTYFSDIVSNGLSQLGVMRNLPVGESRVIYPVIFKEDFQEE